MAVTTVTEHTRRQAANLRALRERLKLKRSTVASRLGFEGTRGYELYEQAKTRLVADQIPVWAAAFGISQREFVESVLLADSEWDRYRTELIEAGALSEEAEKIVSDSEGMDTPARHDLLASVVETWRKSQKSAHTAPARTKRKEQRAI